VRFASSALAAVAVAAVGACQPGPRMTVPLKPYGLAVGTVDLKLSSVHVAFGRHPVLIDTGSPGDFVDLQEGLKKLGVRLADIKCAVVTHGHADHAGNARMLQQRGIKIVGGSGDLWRDFRGLHGKLEATSFFARLLKVIIPGHYTPFWPDIRVTGRYDLLRECGLDAEAIVVGGHTAGSLVVIAAGGKLAFVGDLFRGGALAGYVHRSEPKEHFYQEDLKLVHDTIRKLARDGVELFVMGQGGPSKRADVQRVFGR
jgi:glyoxylase-like metal-dependent hydrolase (beta-lactamase superfamily II)